MPIFVNNYASGKPIFASEHGAAEELSPITVPSINSEEEEFPFILLENTYIYPIPAFSVNTLYPLTIKLSTPIIFTESALQTNQFFIHYLLPPPPPKPVVEVPTLFSQIGAVPTGIVLGGRNGIFF